MINKEHAAPGAPFHSSLTLQPGMRAVITGGTGALGTLLARCVCVCVGVGCVCLRVCVCSYMYHVNSYYLSRHKALFIIC